MNNINDKISNQNLFILTQNNTVSCKTSSIACWNSDFQIYFCTEGEGNIFINGKSYQIKRGQLAIIPANRIYCLETESKMICANLIITKNLCDNMNLDAEKMVFSPVLSSPKLYSLFLSLIKTENDRIDFKEARQSLIILELLNELLMCFLLKRPPTIRDGGSKNVKNIILYINNNFSGKISLDNIASDLQINKFTLAREFKALTDKTIFEYINIYRCIEADKLIKSGLKVKDAAINCGFNNFSYFTKTFKNYIGRLPSK